MPIDDNTGTGTETGGTDANSTRSTSNNASAGASAAQTATLNDDGYPNDTPVHEMPIEQQAAYWKALSRKHESRVKSLGGPDNIKELKTAQSELNKLRKQTATDQERAIIEAREAAETSTAAKFARQLVEAEFRAATAGRVKAEDLSDFLAPMNLSYFLNDDQTVDLTKVAQLASKLTGVTGTGSADVKNGASAAYPFTGQGQRQQGPNDPLAAGRAAFEARKGRTSY